MRRGDYDFISWQPEDICHRLRNVMFKFDLFSLIRAARFRNDDQPL